MQGWQQFFEMIGGAAATLLGLLFVAISMNADIILARDGGHLKRLAEQAFQNYLAVLVITLIVFFPHTSLIGFGYSAQSTAVVWGVWVIYRAFQATREPAPPAERFRTARRYIGSIAGYGSILFGANRLAAGGSEYLSFWICIGTMLLLIAATIVSWDLLIEVAQGKYAAAHDGEKRDAEKHG